MSDAPSRSRKPRKEDDLNIDAAMPPELAKALTRKAVAEARIAESTAKVSEMELKNVKASDDANCIMIIDGPLLDVDGGVSVNQIRQTLMRWHRRDPGADITIYLSTQGGSVFDGNTLLNTLKQLRTAGHRITIYGSGCIMSLGAILLQAADERILDKDTVFMIHTQHGAVVGSIDDREDQEKMLKGVQARHLDFLAERSNLSVRQIKAKSRRKDWYLSADEALEYGFCDRVE